MDTPLLLTDSATAKFPLGGLYATPGVVEAVPNDVIGGAIRRHACGDWGDLGDDDKHMNDRALAEGGRIFSAYHHGDTKFWVITEAGRDSTTVLLPHEY